VLFAEPLEILSLQLVVFDDLAELRAKRRILGLELVDATTRGLELGSATVAAGVLGRAQGERTNNPLAHVRNGASIIS
jgi:hypothetical protein